MNRTRIVSRETFKNQMKSPSFWVMLLLPIVIMIVSLAIGYFASQNVDKDMYVVADPKLNIDEAFESQGFKLISEDELDDILADEDDETPYAKVWEKDGKIIADFYTSDVGIQDKMIFQSILETSQLELNRANAKLDPSQAEILSISPQINELTDDHTDNKNIAMGIYYVLLFLMYMVLISFIQIIITETATEKGTKMIEFIFSSVRPGEYFRGKILGNFLAAMIEILAYTIFGLIGFMFAQSRGIFDGLDITFNLNPEIIAMIIEIVVLFLLGILISLIFAAMLGSYANKVEDAGKYGSPLIFIIVAIFFVANALMNKGDIMATKILSYLPFTSTFFMPLRLINGYASMLEGLIAIAILIIAILLVYRLSEKTYKKNILNYSAESWFKKKK